MTAALFTEETDVHASALRKDLSRMEGGPLAVMADSLRRHGVADAVIEEAVAEAMTKNS